MADTIIDSIMLHVPQQAIDALAARFIVSRGAAATGVGTAVTAVLTSLVNRSNDMGLMQQLMQHAHDVLHSGVLEELTSVAAGRSVTSGVHTGAGFISNLFGSQLNAVENAVAKASGLPLSAGASLMSIAGPATLGYLGQQVSNRGLSASSLGGWLAGEASSLRSLLPSGLGSLLAGGTAMAGGAARRVADDVRNVEPKSGSKGWLIPLLVLALVAIAWLLMRGCNKVKPAPEPASTQAPAAAPVVSKAPVIPALGAFIDRKLADGTVLHIPTNGIENHLIDFIESSKPVDKTTWFDFDRLLFDTNSATLEPSSQEQLSNIDAILKAYPRVHAKIGGYTDNSGDAVANLKLSDDRANNVMHELVGGGIDATRLEAKGYGEEHPVASNDTPEGRQQNRRISLLVTAK